MIRIWKRWLSKDITQIVNGNKHLISKNSKYIQFLIKAQLEPIKQTSFKRNEIITTKYDNVTATTLYKLKNDILKDSKLALLIDQNFINQIIPLLLSLTSKIKYLPFETLSKQKSNEFIPPRLLERVPPLPNLIQDPTIFQEYIKTITHAKIIKQQNLPILLRTLANPLNNTTTPLHTVETYNDILYYFKTHWDFASMREIFKFINLHPFIKPNLTTFNIILSSLSQNNKIRKAKDIIIDLKFYLNLMERHKIEIDERTWEIIISFITTSQGKLQFIKVLKRNDVKINDWITLQVMKEYPQEMINYIKGNHSIILSSRLNNLVVKSCLMKDNFPLAWNFIFTNASSHSTNDQTLNLFLVPLSSKGSIDECLLLYKWFNDKMGVKGNIKTFELILKAHVRNGYSKRFPLIYQWLINLCKSTVGLTFTPNNYWKLKCQSIIKFNCLNDKIKPGDLEKLTHLYSKFNLEDLSYEGKDTVWNLSKDKPEIRKFLRLLNVVKSSIPSRHKSSYIKNNDETRLAKREYLNRRKDIAITNSSFKKLSYVDNWYKALNKEFGKKIEKN